MSSPDLFALDIQTDRQLARFIQLHPKRLRGCAQIHPRIAQLATSFPLLFTLLINKLVPIDLRAAAVRLIVDGAPLNDIGLLLGVPYCLRHLPPEACPNHYRPHHWSIASSPSLRATMPTDPAAATRWLQSITFAAQLGDECIALWVARQQGLFIHHRYYVRALHPLILFAWCSRHHPQLVHPCESWSPHIQIRKAIDRCFSWLDYLKVVTNLGMTGLEDPWIARAIDGDLEFVPITSPRSLKEEAEVMENCLMDYSGLLARHECRLFSVRFRDHRVATMEVRRRTLDKRLYVQELLGPENCKCPLDLWEQVTDFVEASNRNPPKVAGVHHVADFTFEDLLRPYASAMTSKDQGWIAQLSLDQLQKDLMRIQWLSPWKQG